MEWLSQLTDPLALLEGLGPFAYIALLIIIFAECGLLVGFFLPGDSLLFVAGLLVAEGFIDQPIWLVASTVTFAAILGNVVGYWIGAKVGPRLFYREDSRFFRAEYVAKTHSFFERYGAPAIILARFVPIVRTFITAVAGVARMPFRTYFLYSAVGGVIWGAGVTTAGYYLGTIPIIRNHIETALLLLVVVSALPIIVEAIRHRRHKPKSASE